MMKPFNVEEELALLTRGTEEIFPEEEFVDKLRQAREENRPLRVKLGVDPTGTDLHLGHIIPLLKLQQFQELGHQAVLIIGDYTATVGDPSGRNQARPQLTHEEVMDNARTYQEQAFTILDPEQTEVVYNGSWFSKLSFQDTIQLMASTTVARILEREDFTNRYKSGLPIGLHELIYPIMQGYDSVMIRADVELGAIDQKFNILAGRDLQRAAGQQAQVGVCNPVLLGTDGVEKMSKSLNNYIGLAEPADEMYGKLMSIPDQLMPSYFELLTQVEMDEIGELETDLKSGRVHPRDAKRWLARHVVTRFHNEAQAQEAEAAFDRVHVHREIPEDMPELKLQDDNIWVTRLVATALGTSRGEARRLISQGGVRLDGEVCPDPEKQWPTRSGVVLQVGKRRFFRIVKDEG